MRGSLKELVESEGGLVVSDTGWIGRDLGMVLY